jgi:predicted ATPase/class 3 adenylate cyclase
VSTPVAKWLDGIDLGQYILQFSENDIDIDILPDLSEEDLEKLGVSMGHRKKMLRAISLLDSDESLDEPTGPIHAPLDAQQTVEARAERRQLTVMFCDLAGSTALSERLDPEEMRNILALYQKTCADIVKNFEGCIARYVGDGLLVYFGYPVAHEDDASRAVYVGLEIIESMRVINEENDNSSVELAVRIGIATGLVVVGDIGTGTEREKMAVVGDTPNLAARLQDQADSNTMVISESTQLLIEGLFEYKKLPVAQLKGITNPVQSYLIVSQSTASNRFEARATVGLATLIGRDEEIGLLMRRWRQACENESQLVLLSAEPGFGKSRVIKSFRDSAEPVPHQKILYFCSPFHTNSAFYPVIDQLERGLRFDHKDDSKQKVEKLVAVLCDLELSSTDILPALASLLSLPANEHDPIQTQDPQNLKNKILEALVMLVDAMASIGPVLMVVEDAHWIDPSSIQFLTLLIERLDKQRFMLVVTHRPEFEPPWSRYSQATLLQLNRLARKDCEMLLVNVCGGKLLPEEVVEQIVSRSDGVPLYVEEFAKALLVSSLLEDKGDIYTLEGSLSSLEIPVTLNDSLMARLDRLPKAKNVAQLAATLGRFFSYQLIEAVSETDSATLDLALSELVSAELILQRGLAPDMSYEFKHALVRDAAYQSLLKSLRQQIHRRVAEVLKYQFPEIADTQPELLAYHYNEAHMTGNAIDYWLKAGLRASARSANIEAVVHLTDGLEMVAQIPDSTQRARRELDLYLAIGPPLMSTRGFAAAESEQAYTRAHELCKQLGTMQELFTVTWGLWLFNQQLGELELARKLSDDLLSMAKGMNDKGAQLQAHHAAWTTSYRLGEFTAAMLNTEQGNALYQFDEHREHAHRFGGHDPGVCALYHSAKCSWFLGYPDRALAQAKSSIVLARKLSQSFSIALASTFTAFVHQYRNEFDQVLELTENIQSFCEERRVAPQCIIAAKILYGWALAAGGQTDKGLSCLQEGLDTFRSTRTKAHGAYLLMLFADICVRTGQAEKGLEVISEARDLLEYTRERTFEAEVYRLEGDLRLLVSAGDIAAEECYQQAMLVAERQQAKSLQLRIASSLARLWQNQGKSSEALELLTPIYQWFDQGSETTDLQHAAVLLSDLNKGSPS